MLEVLGVPLIEAPGAVALASRRSHAGFGSRPTGGAGHFWLRPLFGALAPDFGVSPRFIQVRLMRYDALDPKRPARPRGPPQVALDRLELSTSCLRRS